jgi:hypothetical protein
MCKTVSSPRSSTTPSASAQDFTDDFMDRWPQKYYFQEVESPLENLKTRGFSSDTRAWKKC